MTNFDLRFFGGEEATAGVDGGTDTGDTLFAPDAGDDAGNAQTEAESAVDSYEDFKARYKDALEQEYKDRYKRDFQKDFDRRFKGHKDLEAENKRNGAFLAKLQKVYGVDNMDSLEEAFENDNNFWAEAADRAEMSEEAYKKYVAMLVENESARAAKAEEDSRRSAREDLEKWYTQSDDFAKKMPGFDLRAEAENSDFVSLLKGGATVESAYYAVHHDELLKAAEDKIRADTEKKVLDTVRANGVRPKESGLKQRPASKIIKSPKDLTEADLKRIGEAIYRGEEIRF